MLRGGAAQVAFWPLAHIKVLQKCSVKVPELTRADLLMGDQWGGLDLKALEEGGGRGRS